MEISGMYVTSSMTTTIKKNIGSVAFVTFSSVVFPIAQKQQYVDDHQKHELD